MPWDCGVGSSLMGNRGSESLWNQYCWVASISLGGQGLLGKKEGDGPKYLFGASRWRKCLTEPIFAAPKSITMEIQMVMALSHPDTARYTQGLVRWRPAECPWAQLWVSVANGKDSQVVIWAKPGPCQVLVAVFSGRFWHRRMDSSRSPLPRGETLPPEFAFGHLLQVLSFKCCSFM